MSGGFRLWQLTPDRAAEFRAIRLDALRRAPEAFGSSFSDWEERPLEDFAARLAGCEMWAAGPAPGSPLAVASWENGISPAEPDLGWVMSVYVAPQARGQGLGDAIFARMIGNATAAGMTRMGLHVGQNNLAAQRLYARAGFVATGGPPMLNGRGIWEIEMRRMLRLPLRARIRALRA
ncbi:L-amino acid N-acyltransferase YncA [Paracoccus isoporae]|uniref:L-amino acid N-acyltransferase YncA n=1 Tax=Paracoccus isoporae TaxID=591205 RepID=A0A1G7A949_9RHOB|nr:GNAT family N-acetyltransferase [Paracoccus isoporae]SDE11349.1 L-amino acid N-acyltransferase YncA [Paracoccus isoporae]